MKALKDLKDEILDNKIDNFYVFYGQDFGLRKHYINRIATHFKKVKTLDKANLLSDSTGNTLFKIQTLYIVYNDEEFAKQKPEQIQTYINRLKDDCVILDYENELPTTTLFKEFEQYVTNFPNVQDNIAQEFVDSEINILSKCKKELSFNCHNDYGNILMETDKIKQYSQAKQVSEQNAYDNLYNKGQLLYRFDDFNIDYLMNDILTHNQSNFSFWSLMINKKYTEEFWLSLNRVFNDLQIAYLVKRYGKYDGSSKAYNYGLPWGRAKTIRELNIYYDANYLLYLANEVCEMDYKVKKGLLQQENLFDYFLCMFL